MNAGPARVLEALRRAGDRPLSGETLSEQEGVSRAQVWKHVESLRAHGYEIAAERGDGYQLVGTPDRLYPEEVQAGLETRWLGRELHYFDSVDSTNRVALELARSGSEHGTAVIAEGQTAGRGRLGRAFYSPPYQNLYTSIVLRPEVSTAAAPTWILASAVAVAEAVAHSVDDPDAAEIKWPNDVLLGGRKACGILMELGAEATRVEFLVLGIGVNLNVDRATFPEEFREQATSLSSHRGRPLERVAFVQRLYQALEDVADRCASGGFDAVRERFESRFRMVGRPVRVIQPGDAELSGVALGIDADGALRVKKDGGDEVRVLAGDVTLAKEKS